MFDIFKTGQLLNLMETVKITPNRLIGSTRNVIYKILCCISLRHIERNFHFQFLAVWPVKLTSNFVVRSTFVILISYLIIFYVSFKPE